MPDSLLLGHVRRNRRGAPERWHELLWFKNKVICQHYWKESIVPFDSAGCDKCTSRDSPLDMGLNIPNDLAGMVRSNRYPITSMQSGLDANLTSLESKVHKSGKG